MMWCGTASGIGVVFVWWYVVVILLAHEEYYILT